MEKVENLYGYRFIGYGYDVLAFLLWLPSKNKLYNQCLDFLKGKEKSSVLELGCGTGYLTEKMIATGAKVTAVDQSSGMLERARVRAPEATYTQADILSYRDGKKYDFVALFFVMHELDEQARSILLKSAKEFLNAQGKIVIVDFAMPRERILGRLFYKLLRLWEPESALGVMNGKFAREIKNNELVVERQKLLRNGRVQWMLIS